MAIPQQVRQRSQQVEDMMKPKAQPAEQPEVEVDEQVAQQDQDELRAETNQDVQPEAEFTIDGPDDVAKQLAALQSQLEETNQRYKTLQGMIRNKEDENQRLQAILSQIHDADHQKQDQPHERPADPSESKDREEFGADFVDMVYRAIDRRLAKFEERLSRTEGVANESFKNTTVTAQERFEKKLTERVPNWREYDVTDEFKVWLNSSPVRVEIVRKGMANYDANAIAEIFELYTQLTGKGQDEGKSAPAGKSLEGKVAPSKGRASKPSSAPEKKVWTRSEIAQVFSNRRGFDQKEFEKLQREIFSAQKEGRVDYAR